MRSVGGLAAGQVEGALQALVKSVFRWIFVLKPPRERPSPFCARGRDRRARQADKLFSEEGRNELIDYLAENPLAGDELPGTGGVRKLRFATSGRGKRGGARVICFHGGEHMPVYALLACAKSAETDLNPPERLAIRAVAATLKSSGKERK